MSAPHHYHAYADRQGLDPSLPAYCDVLEAMSDEDAHACIAPDDLCIIGLKAMLVEKRFVAAVSCEGDNAPFVVVDADRTRRGVFASWSATRAMMIAIAVEFEQNSEGQSLQLNVPKCRPRLS